MHKWTLVLVVCTTVCALVVAMPEKKQAKLDQSRFAPKAEVPASRSAPKYQPVPNNFVPKRWPLMLESPRRTSDE